METDLVAGMKRQPVQRKVLCRNRSKNPAVFVKHAKFAGPAYNAVLFRICAQSAGGDGTVFVKPDLTGQARETEYHRWLGESGTPETPLIVETDNRSRGKEDTGNAGVSSEGLRRETLNTVLVPAIHSRASEGVDRTAGRLT